MPWWVLVIVAALVGALVLVPVLAYRPSKRRPENPIEHYRLGTYGLPPSTYSEDGAWWWDGQAWQPTVRATSGPGLRLPLPSRRQSDSLIDHRKRIESSPDSLETGLESPLDRYPRPASQLPGGPPAPYPKPASRSQPPSSVPARSRRARIEAEIAKLKWGFVVFNPPLRMTVATTERIEARITRSIVADVYEGLKGRGDVQTFEARVGAHMTASLQGENFKIETLNTADQYVPLDEFRQWAWDVTPTRRGQQRLHLRVTVRIKLPNHPDEAVEETVLEKEVAVRVNALHSLGSFVGNQWRWIAGTILSAIVAAILTYFFLNPPHK